MPTVRGGVVAVAAVGLVATGLLIGYRELVLLGTAGAAAVALAWLGVVAPVRLGAHRSAPGRVTRGEIATATVELRHERGPQLARTAVHATGFRLAGRGGAVVALAEPVAGPAGRRTIVETARVRGGTPATVTYRLPTHRRGVLTVGPLRVGRRDPLGLCAAQRRLVPAVRVLVRPRWHPLSGVPLGAVPSLDGLLDNAVHGSITFHALREYRPGDELRKVHWRTSARLGTLMVREHVDTALPRLTVLVDDRAASYRSAPAAFEEVAEVAASVLVAAGRDRLPVRLETVSRTGPAMATVDTGLDLLARLRPDAGEDPRPGPRAGAGTDTVVALAGPDAALGPVLPASARAWVTARLGPGASPAPGPGRGVALAAGTAAELVRRWNLLVAAGAPTAGP